MFGEALEDLESCGQSELLRELEVGPPTPQTFLGAPVHGHTDGHAVGDKSVDGILPACHVCHVLTRHPPCKGVFTQVRTHTQV